MLLHAENLQEESGLQEVKYSSMDTGRVIDALLLSQEDAIYVSTAKLIKLLSTYGNNTYCGTHPSQNYLNFDKYMEKQCA